MPGSCHLVRGLTERAIRDYVSTLLVSKGHPYDHDAFLEMFEEGGDVEEAHGASSVHTFSLPESSGADVDGKEAPSSIQPQHSAGAGDAEEGRGIEDSALVREEEGGEELDTRHAVFLTRREVKWLRGDDLS